MKLTEWINLGLLAVAVAGGLLYLGNLDGRINALDPGKIDDKIEEGIKKINRAGEEILGRIVESGQRPILHSKVYKWKQGQPEVEMIGVDQGFCTFVYVTGAFEGSGEAVWIVEKGSSWYLEGKSHQLGVEAHAQCWNWNPE